MRIAIGADRAGFLLKEHLNDANVLSIGGRIVAFGLADLIATLWLETPFEGGRHQRRNDRIAAEVEGER